MDLLWFSKLARMDALRFYHITSMRPEHFRFKTAEPGSNKEWQCCICLHVRTATIMFGLWHMLLHILAMSIMVALLNNPSLIISTPGHDGELMRGSPPPPRSMPTQIQFGSDEVIRENAIDSLLEMEKEQREMSRSMAEFGPTRRPDYDILRKQMLRYTDIQSGILITFCTMMMTMALVMGALRGKPSLLMPFFCFQLFDFCIGVLAGLSYMTSLSDVHRIVADSNNVPFQNMLLEMNPNCLALIVILGFTMALVIKGYFIRVVWKCYKYLVLKATTRHSIHVIDTPSYDSQNLLPPYPAAKYATAPFGGPPPSYDLATAPFAGAPPSYTVAMSNRAGASVMLPEERVAMETERVAMETEGRVALGQERVAMGEGRVAVETPASASASGNHSG
ncbi:lysosomal-associated transmembrane protein 4B isoform X1 [Diaphorina citri]|uniref:Lysosomal-associated transmembrane protein 4B isoform X1 n=3 Tax=Diaphorina citri TaxID=121845 RepID=A0A1S3CU28_DIACI|nr:lysosomal-associated transmembrane protein 4B isoform X1 [Diaphorina citri]